MKFNFTKHTRTFLLIPGVISLFAVMALGIWGLHAGIDLSGGSLLQTSYLGGRPDIAQVHDVVSKLAIGEVRVQPTGTDAYIFRARTLTNDEKVALESALGSLGTIHEDQFTSVGPTIGRELLTKGLIALALVAISIILFIAFAFRGVSKPVASWKYGVIAIITLAHDILVPTGLFAFLGHVRGAEVDSLFIVGLLTLLGVSINDTIVVFDRIRENLRKNEDHRVKEPFAQTVGHSADQTISRSINTSLTVVIVLLALYVLGPLATRDFALTIITGVIAGTYSSLLLAAPLLVEVERWQVKRSK
ncbi:protein translocase subunit SecF [Candidatus Kaiserbacteria bacterium]|nr:protein translocase subunit SecF [Candidatus Kaiserbacteria bacterium]